MNRRHAAAVLMTSVVFSLSSLVVMAQESNDAMKGMKGMSSMHMDAGHAPAGAAAAKLGDLDISGGFVRAMLPGQPVGGGYLTIHNGGSGDDKLVSVTSSAEIGRASCRERVL